MKRIIIALMLCIVCSLRSLALPTSIFEHYADYDDVTVVCISKAMFKLMPDMNAKANGMDIGALASKLDRIEILTCEKKGLIPELKFHSEKMLKEGKYENLMRVNDSGEKVDIFMSGPHNGVNSYFIRTIGKNEFNLIVITGTITPEDVMGMYRKSK